MKFKYDNKGEIFRALALLTQIGITMVVTIGMMLLLGAFLDSKLGTSPWLLIVCTIMGVLAAFRSVFRMASGVWDDKDKKK